MHAISRPNIKKWGRLLCLSVFLTGALQAQIQFTETTDVAEGISYVGETYGASWGDLNGDGYPDLFVSHHRDLASLYRNNGNGTFTDVLRNVDISATWTTFPVADTHGSTWVDFDNDGDDDLLELTGVKFPPNFVRNDNGILTNITDQYQIGDDREGRFPVWFDYDIDGKLDVSLINRAPNIMLHQGSSSFSNVTNITGFDSFRAAWGQLTDINNDGNLDLLVIDGGIFPNKAFDYTTLPFTDISSAVPVITGSPIDLTTMDLNGDALPDLFTTRGPLRINQVKRISGSRIESRLAVGLNNPKGDRGFTFSANGPVHFTLHTRIGLVKTYIGSQGAHPASRTFTLDPADTSNHGIATHNYANDKGLYLGYNTSTKEWSFLFSNGGENDRVYIEINGSGLGNPKAIRFNGNDFPLLPRYFQKNQGAGYTEKSNAGFSAMSCISIAAGDFDNDMNVDLYLVCRGSVENIANRLYRNKGNGIFELVQNAGGAQGVIGQGLNSQAGSGDSVAMADYDVDGKLDLFITNGVRLEPLRNGGPDQLYRNTTSNTNHWIEIDLEGVISNRDGIGASVYATAGSVTQLREQNGGYHRSSQNHRRLHFGLADNAFVNLEVRWPSGITDTYSNVAADKLYKITENGNIVEVTLGGVIEPPGDECGKPTYNPATEKALFLWKDCTSNRWTVRATAGGDASGAFYNGEIDSDSTISNVNGFSIEASDQLDFTSDPGKIFYRLNIWNNAEDGFSFTPASGSNTCFEFNNSNGTPVLLGMNKVVKNIAFDLNTLQACAPPVANGGECGKPTFNLNNEKGMYVWKNCSTGEWTVRVTAGGDSSGAFYIGSVDSGQQINNVSGFSLESIDVLDFTTDPMQIQYSLNVWNSAEDGFSFNPATDAGTCMVFDTGTGSESVFLGRNKLPQSEQFDLATLEPCALPPADESCGEPLFDSGADKGVFVWKDCATGEWHVRATAGGDSTGVVYEGNVASNENISSTSITAFSIEGSDIFDSISNDKVIDFQLSIWNEGIDGFDYMPSSFSENCLTMNATSPGAGTILLGKNRVVKTTPFDFNTLGGCN